MEKVNIQTIIGIQEYANKEKYDGDWINGKREGQGNIIS